MVIPPPFLPGRVRAAWGALDVPTGSRTEVFAPERVDALPAPAARWLRRAIVPGAPCRSGARLAMRGTIRFGRWLPFTASQVLAPAGFVWAARAGWGLLAITGFDRFTSTARHGEHGDGEMAWRLGGVVPVLRARGVDTTRSAAGRHAGESFVFAPATALAPHVTWRPVDDARATATVASGGFLHAVTVDVDQAGALRTATFPRWGNPDRGPFREHEFGVIVEGHATFDGVTIPGVLRAGWWPGTDRFADGEFFRATIERAEFF